MCCVSINDAGSRCPDPLPLPLECSFSFLQMQPDPPLLLPRRLSAVEGRKPSVNNLENRVQSQGKFTLGSCVLVPNLKRSWFKLTHTLTPSWWLTIYCLRKPLVLNNLIIMRALTCFLTDWLSEFVSCLTLVFDGAAGHHGGTLTQLCLALSVAVNDIEWGQ